MRSRAAALAASLLAALAVHAAPKADPARSERELKELRGRIERLQKDLAAAEESRGEAVDQLKQSARAVSESQRALYGLAQQRRQLEGELAALGRQEQAARAGVAEQEALAGRLLRLQYEQGAPDRLRLALEGRDAAQVSRHLHYYGYIQRARASLIGQLKTKGEEIARLEAEAAGRRDELSANEREQAEEARRLERERSARAAVVARLGADIEKGRREIGKLRKDEARLTRLVEEIARALAAAPKAPPRSGTKGPTVEDLPDASFSSRPFPSLQGKLRLPVRGEVANRFGAPREEAGSTWKGLFIKAPTGSPVHAVADGRVVYADWLRGFGNLLILDHGKGYMSLYAQGEALLRQVGDLVRAGDPVAQAGASAGQAQTGLYFELRRDGKPFDPMKWVAQ